MSGLRRTDFRRVLGDLGVVLFFCGMVLAGGRSYGALGTLVTKFNMPAARMVADPVRPRIYATLTFSDQVAVIDTNALRVIALIRVGSGPLGLAVSPDGSRLYVANTGSTADGISVIDLATLTVLPSLPVPVTPSDVAVGANGTLYVTPESDEGEEGIMQVTTTGSFQEEFSDGVFVYGGGFLQMSPDQRTLYFGNSGISLATLASFDVSTGTAALLQENESTVGSNGEDLRVSHAGAFLGFAVGSGQGVYEIADIPTNDLNGVNGSFNCGPYPTNIAFSPDDAIAYTEPEGSNELQVFDTNTFVVTGSFYSPGDVSRLVTDNTGRFLFVAGVNSDFTSNPYIYVYETGRTAVTITSARAETIAVGSGFDYQITATGGPTVYGAIGLPEGLSLDGTTGLISGTCNTVGMSTMILSASGAVGVAVANVNLTVSDGLAVEVNGPGGRVTPSLSGTTFPALGTAIKVGATPSADYVFSGWTGTITSTSNPLDFTFTGPTEEEANFTVRPPTVDSAVKATEYGSGFKYQIAAVGIGPYMYGATGLPAGLSVDAGTGLISGTLADAGDFSVSVSGSNAGGEGTGTLKLEVACLVTANASSGGYVVRSWRAAPALSSTIRLTAVPVAGYGFLGWTGAVTSTSNPLIFTAQPTMELTANFVPATTYLGSYSALVSDGTQDVDSSGFLGITLNKTGGFTGSLVIGGARYLLRGDFAPTNTATITIKRGKLAPLTVTLTLNLTGATPEVTGEVTDGMFASSLSGNLLPAYPRLNPSPMAGAYTAALYSSTQSATIPAGTGYATISVTGAGLARMAGALADGTPFSAAAMIGADGTLAVYAPLYAGQGLVTGTLTFSSITNVGELNGVLSWTKPVTSSRGVFPAAFATTLNAVGSSYMRAGGIPGVTGALDFAGGGTGMGFSQGFTLNGPYRVVLTQPDLELVSFGLNLNTGVFVGRFRDDTTLRLYGGVILQQQGVGAGEFLDPAGGGTVDLTTGP